MRSPRSIQLRPWLAKLVARLRRLWGNLTPGRIDRSLTSTLSVPASHAGAESAQAAKPCLILLGVPDSELAKTPVAAPDPQLKTALITQVTAEEEAAGLQEKAESAAAEGRMLPDSVPTFLESATPGGTELASVRPPNGSTGPSQPRASDDEPPPQHVASAGAEIARLDDEEIPLEERCEAAPPLGLAPTRVCVPFVQLPPMPQLGGEHSEPATAPQAAKPHRETPHGEKDVAMLSGGWQAIGAAEELEMPAPGICGHEPLPAIGERELSTPPPERRTWRVAPENRARRRRGSSSRDSAELATVSQRNGPARQHRPELVCWLQGMNWVVGVEVPEELQRLSLQVQQSPDVRLEEESSSRGRWRIKEPLKSVEFIATEPDEICVVSEEIPAVPYRIFKVIGTHGTHGRAVRQGSTGHFLIVVPELWRWNEELSGPATGTAEYVSPGTCRAHHVDLPLEVSRALAFDTPEGNCVRIPCAGQRFKLEGQRIDDVSEGAGPLFVREPPYLRWAAGTVEDGAISLVVVGEEGRAVAERGWRVHDRRFDHLRPAIAARRAGWFFVRLYDSCDELIESLDFRFVADLDAIEVEAGPPVPGFEGHSSARIRFRHGHECIVSSRSAVPLAMESVTDGSSVIVPANTQLDETHWLIGPINGPYAEVNLLIERLWWAHVKEEEPNEPPWTDRPLSLCRQDFKATSVAAVKLRLPRPGWADEVLIGFEAGRSRSVHLRASERECIIPLRDLGESREIEDQTAAKLCIWLTRRGHTCESLEAVVAVLAAEASPLLEGKGFLCSLDQLKPRILMAVLTRIRTACRAPLRNIICDLRTESYECIPKRQRGTACEMFVREGLCILALALEQPEVLKTCGPKLPERWAHRARAAQAYFPEVMSAVRSRHREIETQFGTKHGAQTRRRTDRC